MSLLQEALKRKENDDGQRASAGDSPTPVTALSAEGNLNLSAERQAAAGKDAIAQDSPPRSMPVREPLQAAAPSRSIRRKASLLWVLTAIIAISIAIMIAGGFIFLFYHYLTPMKTIIVQQAHLSPKTDAIVPGDTNMVSDQPAAKVQKTAPGSEPISPFAATTAADAGKGSAFTSAPPQPFPSAEQAADYIQRPEINAVSSQPAGVAEPKPAPTKPILSGSKTPMPSPPATRWPALKLTGILRRPGMAESTAFINGKMVGIGQTIENVTLVEIQADGVLLEYGAEKKFLRVGAVLY